MPPGWYPDPATGQQRWWDGLAWGAYGLPQNAYGPTPNNAAYPQAGVNGYVDPVVASSRSSAALAHYLGLLGFIGPLIIMLTSGVRDPFVRGHAVEALNFHLTGIIGWVIVSVLSAVTCGVASPLALGILIPVIIFAIQAGGAASRGEWYRYPWTIRMVN